MKRTPMRDAAEIPRYDIPEAAAYLRVKPRTLATWVRGRKSAAGESPPLIIRPVPGDSRLSYSNLIEGYVIHVLRKQMKLSLMEIRKGIEYVEKEFGIQRFLLSDQLRVRLGNLLVEEEGRYYNVGRSGGQIEIPEAVEAYLKRIEYRNGFPEGLYPVTRPGHPEGPRRIVILPDVGFGKPVTERNHISAAVIASRFGAGESVSELAEDYELEAEDIEEAIRTERPPLAA